MWVEVLVSSPGLISRITWVRSPYPHPYLVIVCRQNADFAYIIVPKKGIKLMGKIVIILAIGFLISLNFALRDCSKQIEQKGLKIIIEEIWEGKK